MSLNGVAKGHCRGSDLEMTHPNEPLLKYFLLLRYCIKNKSKSERVLNLIRTCTKGSLCIMGVRKSLFKSALKK